MRPIALELEEGPAVVKLNLCGAGVVVGVVDSKMDFGFASGIREGAGASISSSFDSGAGGCLAASFKDKAKPLSKKGPLLSLGLSLSLAVVGSALKVVPRTNGEDPKGLALVVLDVGGRNALSESIEMSAPGVPKEEPGGLLGAPNTEGLSEFPARDANPPLFAKLANPPEAVGLDVVALPNTLPVPGVALPKLDCPKAGFAAVVELAAHGDVFMPIPIPNIVDWPKAGAAPLGLLPKAEEPNEGVPNAGAVGGVAAENGLAPNADGFVLRAGGVPNAVGVLAVAPNAVVVDAAGADGCAAGLSSSAVKPG